MSKEAKSLPVVEALAYIGNSEKKCVLQLLVEPGEEVTAREITDRFAEAQVPDEAVKYKSLNNLPQTIMSSHRRAGVFETADTLRFRTWWARKAEESGLPDSIAGHMLALSADCGLSLEKLWGKVSTRKGEKNSPQIRSLLFGCLSELAVGSSVSIVEVGVATGLSRGVVHDHVQKLSGHGFIEYSAVNPTSQEVSFGILSDSVLHSTLTGRGIRERDQIRYGGSHTLRYRVGVVLVNALQNGRETITYDELGDKLASNGEVNIATLQGVVGIMLREGILARRHKSPHSDDVFSDIKLGSDQKEIIDRCNNIITGLQTGRADVLGVGLNYGMTIMDDRDLVTQLLRRSYEHSPFTP